MSVNFLELTCTLYYGQHDDHDVIKLFLYKSSRISYVIGLRPIPIWRLILPKWNDKVL